MKRVLALLLCLLLLGAAFCEGGAARDGVELTLNGQTVFLDFDTTEAYSSVMNGSVQASFFAYANGEEDLYELYMVFPEGVRSGDDVTPEYALSSGAESSVVLIITDNQDEAYYFAGQIETGAYPDGSSYDIRFDTVAATSEGTRYEGRLTATLVGMEMNSGTTLGSVSIADAPFRFTMPAANRRAVTDAPDATPAPFDAPATAPEITPMITPAQTWRI